MAQGNFDACHDVTAKFEGGYVNHPADPGGATNWGITIGVLRQERGSATVADVKALTYAEAKRIFKTRFWNPVGAETMPRGVDLACYDWGVNSGVSRGKRAYADTANIADIAARVKAICAARRNFFAAIIARNGKLAAFRKGWANRLAAVEATAYRWALVAQGKSGSVITREMQAEAAKAGTAAAKKQTQAKTAGGASAPAGGGIAAAGWNWEGIAFGVVVFGVLAFIGFMAWRAAQAEAARKVAFQEAANG